MNISSSKRRIGKSASGNDGNNFDTPLFMEMEMESPEIVTADDGGASKSVKSKRKLRRRKLPSGNIIYLFLFVCGCFGILLQLRSNGHRSSRAQRLEQLNKQRLQMGRALHIATPSKNLLIRGGQADSNCSASLEKSRGPIYQRSQTHKSYYEQLLQQKQFFVDPRHLPLLPSKPEGARDLIAESMEERPRMREKDFYVYIAEQVQDWEEESDDNPSKGRSAPFVDYTKHDYKYADLIMDPAEIPLGDYPYLQPLEAILREWPQDDIDHPPSPIMEHLMVFDYQNPEHQEAAKRFRDAELPFKVTNVPEVIEAGKKWTDEYVSRNFDLTLEELGSPLAKGTCQQSQSNFFAFFNNKHWNVDTMGPPPSRDTDLSFALWAKHARYADKVGLPPDAAHYYWQAGVPAVERRRPYKQWVFISRDLPSFSSPKDTFFAFDTEKSKGIQCRFGERGVTAATHYDAGRNMVAMISGAKRYILSPPIACPRLGIVTMSIHPSFRHSMLNFAHVNLLDENHEELSHLIEGMSGEEREWLEIARDAPALSTILKAGEVLYIPSHWFHYITSLQKSAQCNVRSGRETEGFVAFGGFKEVTECIGEAED